MLIHPWDAMTEADAWAYLAATGFGTFVAPGAGRDVPVLVPSQFTVVDRTILLHLARPNPFLKAVEENPAVLLSVTGDVAYLPSDVKVTADEDPLLGIPTTYYTSVQVTATAAVVDAAGTLRQQLADVQPGTEVADPSVHAARLTGIRALLLTPTLVRGKAKYGGNNDDAHRAVTRAYLARTGRADLAAKVL